MNFTSTQTKIKEKFWAEKTTPPDSLKGLCAFSPKTRTGASKQLLGVERKTFLFGIFV